jgi:hypothetical protein
MAAFPGIPDLSVFAENFLEGNSIIAIAFSTGYG